MCVFVCVRMCLGVGMEYPSLLWISRVRMWVLSCVGLTMMK